MKNSGPQQFVPADYAEPHIGRMRRILAAHPEVRKLFGPYPLTALWTVAVVGVQMAAAIALHSSPWWLILAVSYTLGAFANHACFVLIHDAAHNLVFRNGTANRWVGILANFPIIFPSAISFRNYHLLHHRHQGELSLDADLPSPWEARLFGGSALTKAIWFLFFFVFEGVVRPSRLKTVKLLDGWTVVNIIIEVSLLVGLSVAFGPVPFIYLFLSSIFSIGLHPLGARWIQEHYLIPEATDPTQETYSYYGALNRLTFNVGYHNEHHDMVMIPWVRLPKLKAMAPEFYDSLYSHRSWTKLMLKFLFDSRMTLFSRVTRAGKASAKPFGKAEPVSVFVADVAAAQTTAG